MRERCPVWVGGNGMELRVLKYFLTVADEGNITRAADILHVTQPTLSRQLMELESELGTLLLIRGKRSVTLTDEGFLFKQQAETIVELADKLEHTFKDQKDMICGTIRIGATEAVGGRTLAVYMKEFRDMYPDVQFDLYNGMAVNIKEMIEHGLLPLPAEGKADEYNVIFAGSPDWCGTIAPPLTAWLGGNDLSGKIILPFFSHCGGADSGMEQAVRNFCPGEKVRSSLYVLENGSGDLAEQIRAWIKQNLTEECDTEKYHS